MLVDRPAGQVVAHCHLPVSAFVVNPRINLLMRAHCKRHVPVALTIQFVDSLLHIRFPALFLGDQFFNWPVT